MGIPDWFFSLFGSFVNAFLFPRSAFIVVDAAERRRKVLEIQLEVVAGEKGKWLRLGCF